MFLLICLPDVFLLTGAGTAILSLICIRCDIIRTPDPCLRPLRSRDRLTGPICTSNGFNFPCSYWFITTRMLIMSLMNILGPRRERRCPCWQTAEGDKGRAAEPGDAVPVSTTRPKGKGHKPERHQGAQVVSAS